LLKRFLIVTFKVIESLMKTLEFKTLESELVVFKFDLNITYGEGDENVTNIK
jgi:hypothetical protein